MCLSRRIGLAFSEFRKLKQVWSHANLSRKQKLAFFQAFVLMKLQYGLATCCLVKVQRRRLDGFHARCLRRILGIPAAYISRVSNAAVFAEAGAKPITEQLTGRQLMLLRRVGKSPAGSSIRKNTLRGDSATPVVGFYIRRQGRPRYDWTSQALTEAACRCGSWRRMEHMLLDGSAGGDIRWKQKMGI